MNCNTTHYRANSSSVPGDPTDLADFKRPRHYFFIDEIPSNPTGKVERGKLKDLLMKQVGRELD